MSQDTLLIALSLATLVVATVAAVYAMRVYRLKSGIEIRGSFGFASSVAAEDRYVHEVTLENLKDRAVVIFKIFVELGHGYYIEIEDFEHEPLLLRPFEAFRRRYEPIDQYSVGMRRIRIDSLVGNRNTRRRLVLSTAQGRYNVSSHIARWDPVSDFFKNHVTAIIYPLRSTFEGKAYGSGTKYIVRLRARGREDEIVPIYSRDHEVKKFRTFQLTAESLSSRDALEAFLLEEAMSGNLRCADLEVFDMEQWRNELYREHASDEFEATPRNWFVYHVLGRAVTKWHDFQLWQENRANRQKHQREVLKRERERRSSP
jgi:hypothetical protein